MMADIKGPVKKPKLFDRFLESPAFKDLRSAVDKLLEKPIWWTSERRTKAAFIKPLPRAQRARDMSDYLAISEYKKTIINAMAQAEKTRQAFVFAHPLNNTYGISIPLISENRLFGFCGVCGAKFRPNQGVLDIISGYIRIILQEMSKESELTKVYELVRPRAVALSTVHTIHRLISSTLDIKELFPRIARLSLQVLRAERARICMIDKNTKRLVTVASVDYRKTKNLFKTTRPSSTEEEVAKAGLSVRKSNLLCVPLVDEETCGVIAVRDKIGKERFTIFDQEILTTLAEQAIIAIKNAQLYKEQEDITIGTIKSLAHLLDAKFPYTYTHTDFFVDLMLELGKELNLNKNELKLLHYAAVLPDLGKLVTPDEILKKPRALTGKERKIIKTRTLRGIEILKYLDVLKPVVPIILHHHERFDGKGYPSRLKAEEIPLGSRILAVGDTFEAMVCHRPYRHPMPFMMAVSEIRRQAGSQFDPNMVKAFMRLVNDGRLEGLMRKHHDRLKKVF